MEKIKRDGLIFYFFDDFADYLAHCDELSKSLRARYRLRNVEVVENVPEDAGNMKKFFFKLRTSDGHGIKGTAQLGGEYSGLLMPSKPWNTLGKERDLFEAKPGDIVTIGGLPYELKELNEMGEGYELLLRYFRKQEVRSAAA